MPQATTVHKILKITLAATSVHTMDAYWLSLTLRLLGTSVHEWSLVRSLFRSGGFLIGIYPGISSILAAVVIILIISNTTITSGESIRTGLYRWSLSEFTIWDTATNILTKRHCWLT